MPRIPRPDYEHTYHHVIVRGVDGLGIFDTDEKKQTYLDILQSARQSHDISLYAFGFVYNHLHQLVRRNQHEMGRFYRRVNGRYSQWYNQTYNRTGTLYDDRYFSVLIDDDRYLQSIWRYIHYQGVHAGRYETPIDDPWNSAALYAGESKRYDWLDWEQALQELNVPDEENVRKFLMNPGEEQQWFEEGVPYEVLRGERILGEDAFVEQYMQIRKETVRESRRDQSPVDWERLVDMGMSVSGLDRETLLTPVKSPRISRHRSGLAYAGRRYGHLTLGELSKRMGVSPSGISRMIKRCKEKHTDVKDQWDEAMQNRNG